MSANGLCECGCGKATVIAIRNEYRRGHVKGEPLRYIHGHNVQRPLSHYQKNGHLYYTVNEETGCWEWKRYVNKSGYGRMSTGRQRGRKYWQAHRFFYVLYKGYIADAVELDHLCRNRKCVNPEHLEPVSSAENSRRGVKTKLTAKQVEEIRALFGKMRLTSIAREFGVSPPTVFNIRAGRIWKTA